MAVLEELDVAAVHATIHTYRDGLLAHREAINQLNVYPVPDGDTGTNMSLTIESVLAELEGTEDSMPLTCKAIAHGSLMGARGNSGVIMSQILRGITDSIDSDTVGPEALATALTTAARAAYGAVMKPVEGTILTVARETGDAAASAAAEGCDLEDTLRRAAEAGQASLEKTPELLPVLAEAGVVDAGGRGYLLLIDALRNVVADVPMPDAPDVDPVQAVQVADGHEEHRYEVMFLLDAADANMLAFKESWAAIGDSIVVVGSGGLWNCHIHTVDIGGAIEAGIEAGRPRDIRVTDLWEEVDHVESMHALTDEPLLDVSLAAADHALTGVVAVGVGAGIRRIFESLGVQAIVGGGQTMNPPTELLIQAVEQVNADEVVILPNNKNIIPVAEQVDGQTDKRVTVVPTRAVAEGFASLLAYDPESDSGANAKAMAETAETVIAGEVTQAVREAGSPVGDVGVGDFLGIGPDGISAIADSVVGASTGLLDAVLDDSHELVTLIEGSDVAPGDTDAVVAWLAEHHPAVEVEVHSGGQPLYHYYLGVE